MFSKSRKLRGCKGFQLPEWMVKTWFNVFPEPLGKSRCLIGSRWLMKSLPTVNHPVTERGPQWSHRIQTWENQFRKVTNKTRPKRTNPAKEWDFHFQSCHIIFSMSSLQQHKSKRCDSQSKVWPCADKSWRSRTEPAFLGKTFLLDWPFVQAWALRIRGMPTSSWQECLVLPELVLQTQWFGWIALSFWNSWI